MLLIPQRTHGPLLRFIAAVSALFGLQVKQTKASLVYIKAWTAALSSQASCAQSDMVEKLYQAREITIFFLGILQVKPGLLLP